MKKPLQRNGKKVAVLVAAVSVVMVCSLTAFAMNIFGLKDLVFESNEKELVTTVYKDNGEVTKAVVPVELISLQGFSGSNEHKAAEEWNKYIESYDKDGSILKKVGNGPTNLNKKYDCYLVYTQEMADKLEEIVSKYGLKLHQTLDILTSTQDLFSRTGIEDFLGKMKNEDLGIYVYEDGTFKVEGDYNPTDFKITNDGNIPVDVEYFGYQFMNCKKGSFTDTFLNIGNKDDYKEWTYTTSSGVPVSLSFGPKKCLVVADLDNSFVTINVLAGSDEDSGKLTQSDLEKFADSFNLSLIE